jgi:Tol biopolymer transport system component
MSNLIQRVARVVPLTLTLLLLAVSVTAAQEPAPARFTELSPGSQSVVNATLSPDGRWVVFAQLDSESNASLWVMPAAGGTPARITGEGYWDHQASWSPAGDRLFFSSNRAARAGVSRHYGMVVGFDPATGRASGTPRQVTVDPLAGGIVMQVSPDGRSVGYYTRDGGDGRIRVAPAAGGQARTVVTSGAWLFNLRWSSDGRDLLYSERSQQGPERVAYRVPAAGGTATEIFRTEKNIQAIGPDGRFFALMGPGATTRERVIEVVRGDGRVVARHVGGMALRAEVFSSDGQVLVGTSTMVTAPVRVAPIGGGRPIDVTAGTYYDWPAGWSADGTEVLVFGDANGKAAILSVGANGQGLRGQPAALPEEGPHVRWWDAHDDHLVYTAGIEGTTLSRLVAVNRKDGSRSTLSETFVRGGLITGLGGRYNYGGNGTFLYFDRQGDEVRLTAAAVGRAPRVLRSFPAAMLDRTSFAVHGDRVAWYRAAGDSAHLEIAFDPSGPAQRLLTVPGGGRCCQANLSFSPDGGRLLTQEFHTPDAYRRMVLLDLAEDGRSVRARRTLDTGAHYWYEPQWLPDRSGVTVLAGYEGLRTHVLLVPFREGEAPVAVTRDDPSPKWGHMLSPDGRHVAYPGEVWQGGTIWLMDLSGAGVASARR